MSDQTILDALRGVAFFHDLADAQLERLAEIARLVEFPADSEMFHEYDTAKDVYVILSGKVSLVIFTPKFGWRQLAELGAGELIGWSPLVGREHLFDTAKALVPTKALAIDGEKLLALCKADPTFGCEFMHRAAKVLAQRLGATHSQLREITGFDLPSVPLESD
jgi:CRP/FNR family transcriptional regulator, cyclic AMP receptor protein